MLKKFVLLVLLSCASAAYAFISSEGDSFEVKYNKHGAVLTSEFVKYRFEGSGAATEIIRKKAKIYLGKNCDAKSKFYGEGTWTWETRGFFVSFGERQLIFMGQLDIKECGPSWSNQ